MCPCVKISGDAGGMIFSSMEWGLPPIDAVTPGEKENDGNEYFYEIPLAEFFLVDHFHLSVGQCLCQSSHFLQFSATFGTQVKVFLKERFFLGGHFIHHVLSDLCGGICTLFLFHCITILE